MKYGDDIVNFCSFFHLVQCMVVLHDLGTNSTYQKVCLKFGSDR